MTLPTPTALIPHRAPQLLLSRLVHLEGAELTAEGEFRTGEWPSEGVPGTQLVEGLAQTMACLGRLQGEEGAALLLGVPTASFPAVAHAPCTLRFTVQIVDQRYRITEASGVVTRATDGVVVCSAILNAALVST